MKKLSCLVCLFVLLLTACGKFVPIVTANAEPRALTVFAASSLTDAFQEIGNSFESLHPSVTVRFNFAGSQSLRTQIEQGALVDVFASANNTEMDNLVSEGFIGSGTTKIFLTNQLVIILPVDNPAHLTQINDLANPGIKLVLAAEDVPVGKYARQVLEKMNGQFGADFKDRVISNIVSNEDNVKQIVAKIQLGEADAGIVYASDVVAASDVKSIEIPADLNVIAKYPIAVLSHSPLNDLAADFVSYVLDAKGQAVLKKWGFNPIQE